MKPVELVERAIVNSSRKGDLVLDPFAGSGRRCWRRIEQGAVRAWWKSIRALCGRDRAAMAELLRRIGTAL